ncbi:uncharacterized protein LOC106873754 [Octopus bimaculoides]|uniref:Uncharacterized protein n=1 Tax=Octopus bimaculoides TaxID=37653 RepID=A0A0L8GZA0_OCTBM|nr:uncharacterized protein LOC106873754 [Octopus bimaculoides]XP_014776740.1 uncharacterized protein LOC106873754 [Octopus bimaculoides]|eukprot:XP_014776738.1 PREDICTED: uncharacterized protein LOC106873754 [Octopus bimaculoides]
MGRKKETPVTQKLKTLKGSPDIVLDADSPKTEKPQVVKRSSSRVRKIQSNFSEITQNKTTKASSTMAILNTDMPKEVTSELSPKMFYSKRRSSRSVKSVGKGDSTSNIPSRVTQAKKTIPLNENDEDLKETDDAVAGISPKSFYSRSRKRSQVQPVPKDLSKKLKQTEKPIGSRRSSTKQQFGELVAEQIPNELSNNSKDKKLFPVAEVLESVVNDDCAISKSVASKQTRVSRIKNNSSKVPDGIASTKKAPEMTVKKRSLRISTNTPIQTSSKATVSKRKNSGLTIAEIVAEVSTEGASGLKSSSSNIKTDSSTSSVKSSDAAEEGKPNLGGSLNTASAGNCTSKNTKRKTPKKSLSKKASGSAESEWDKSLLLVTDELDSSKNVYDFEEFQVGSSQGSGRKSTSRQNTNSGLQSSMDKKLSVKKMAAIKAVFNDKKKKIPTGSKKAKVNKTTKKVQPSKNNLGKHIAVNKAVPVNGNWDQTEECKVPVVDKMSVTPADQLLNGVVSFREIEKVKAKKHIENKIVSKINPSTNRQGAMTVTAESGSIWPGLNVAVPTKYTQLKRSPMEGPPAPDIRKVQQTVLPKCLPPILKNTASDKKIGAKKPQFPASGSSKKQIVECDNPGLILNNPPPIGDTNNHIDLFTYPVPITKKRKVKTDQSGKLKENKGTPSKGFMDFLYAGSVKRYLKPLKQPVPEKPETSPAAVMLPKFLTTDTSTPNTSLVTDNVPAAKDFGADTFCISPVKEFQSPASMRTYAHVSRRSSLQSLFTSRINGDHCIDGNSVLQEKKNCKSKVKNKEPVQKNGEMEKWAERMSDEFDEIENFELSIEE